MPDTHTSEASLEGKVAVLTGVSRQGQVGEAVARSLAEQGASVVLIDRTGVEAEARAREIRDGGHHAMAAKADLTDPAQLDAVARAVKSEFGAVDALVNIAGGFGMSGKVSESDPSAWSRLLDIGLTTAYLTTRAFLPLVRERRGAIVFFASAAALPGGRIAGTSAYAVSKAGLIHLTRCMSVALAPHVLVNCVAPGLLEGTRATANLSQTQIDKSASGSLLKRAADKDDCADQVVTMCRTETMTGQTVAIDSGRVFH